VLGVRSDKRTGVSTAQLTDSAPVTPIPIIDLFAGPGGLGEGFSSLRSRQGAPVFNIALSIEKDPVAHRTLVLRSVFRQLRGSPSLALYYDYIAGKIKYEEFESSEQVAGMFATARHEARCLELGVTSPKLIDREIKARLNGNRNWVLIGGPPCQAYSLAGRSRRIRDKSFEGDQKHTLYREYLRIVRVHKPAVFVMENVKGLLSSLHEGSSIFPLIIRDLAAPSKSVAYKLRSFVKRGDHHELVPSDFVIRAEKFGVPQSRHRVILLGVRSDIADSTQNLLIDAAKLVTVADAIDALPKLRSRLSKSTDSPDEWVLAIKRSVRQLRLPSSDKGSVKGQMCLAINHKKTIEKVGTKLIQPLRRTKVTPIALQAWLLDSHLNGVCQHEARSHMESDLGRYLFASCFAKVHGRSPSLTDFPSALLPNHKNAQQREVGKIPFADRFRVQCRNAPATTIVSHIAKDGHYYIHYDPMQCRSFTVREAARIQTFPDNYFFEGNRTEQYTQVGNAVPPFLAVQLARIVANLLDGTAVKEKP